MDYNQCWAARNRTFCESKVPKSQESVHLGDSQNKQEHSYLPSLSGRRVLNQEQTMAKVLVIIVGVPVEGAGIPEPEFSLLACLILRQLPTRHHHPHHIVRLLHLPKIVRHTIHLARNHMVVPDIHPIKELVYGAAWVGQKLVNVTFYEFFNVQFYKYLRR